MEGSCMMVQVCAELPYPWLCSGCCNSSRPKNNVPTVLRPGIPAGQGYAGRMRLPAPEALQGLTGAKPASARDGWQGGAAKR